MAANKFATMLHRITNKITLILIYAVLEWTLIVLLLLNSVFSFLIIKFAEYFGLKPPCLWCSRVDHMLYHRKNKSIHRDLLCEAHATE
ncbi:Myosin-binding protein 2, partial [Datura stramonium]|nr:Myosin-binding protein 2 [Datura stramonium]